jgi:tetratricopeptide (TPR) repeat protein
MPEAWSRAAPNSAMKAVLFAGVLLALCVGAGFAATFQELSARATAAREANQGREAVELYREALALNPKWDEGWWFLGTMLYDGDQYAAASDALSRLVQLQPNAAPALGILGLCEFETGRYAESLAHISRSLSAGALNQPQMEQVLRYHEAMALTRTGRFDEALQKYGWFLRGGMPNASLLKGMGLATLRKPLLPDQIPARQTELFSKAGEAAVDVMMGQVAEGQRTFRDLVQQFPDTPNVHYAYGLSILAGDPNGAVQQFREELAVDPSNGDAGAMLAWILLRRSEYKDALPIAEKAAAEEPQSAVAQFVFGRLLVESGETGKGIARLQTAEKLDPKFLEAHLSLVTAYSRAGKTEESRRERMLAVNISKETGRVVQH